MESKNIYKKILVSLLILTLIPFFSNGQCPSENDFIEVRIQGGNTIYGSQSIKLTYEGLIYRWRDEDFKSNSFFICLDSLDNKLLCELQEYIWVNNLFTLNECDLSPGDSNFISYKRDSFVDFYDCRNHELKSIRYNSCDKRIDKFIKMLIEIVPTPHQEYFQSELRCK